MHFHLRGHDTLALIGGATGSIGDPSGRSTERSFLSPAELERNVASITAQVQRFFERGEAYVARHGGSLGKGKGRLSVVNNLEWTRDVSLLDFLRSVGKMARVNVMMARDRCVRADV